MSHLYRTNMVKWQDGRRTDIRPIYDTKNDRKRKSPEPGRNSMRKLELDYCEKQQFAPGLVAGPDIMGNRNPSLCCVADIDSGQSNSDMGSLEMCESSSLSTDGPSSRPRPVSTLRNPAGVTPTSFQNKG